MKEQVKQRPSPNEKLVRVFETEKCGLLGLPKPTKPVSLPALFQNET